MDGNTQRVWIPPLPQGWEARYDHAQRRYFFINHATKLTQWEDPRFTSAAAASSLGTNTRQSHSSQSRAGESVPMRDLSPRHSSHSNRGSHHETESSLSSGVNMAVVNKLQREFPKATKELITDIFQLCHENERETREQLKDLGFLKDSRTPQHQVQPRQKSLRAPELPKPVSSKPELTDFQKKQLANNLKSQFPKLEMNVISIALSTCDYDVEGTKRLLQAWTQREGPSNATSSRSSSASTSSSTATAQASTSASLEPASLSNARETNPQPLRDSSLTRPSPTRNVAGPSQAARAGSPSNQPQHQKARQVTKKKTKNVARKKETIVTSQPIVGQATPVSHRTVARGPDASLRKGPDSSLLITDYEPAHGPDRSLRQGSDSSRVNGPMGALGADPALRCGPQSCLLQNVNSTKLVMSDV